MTRKELITSDAWIEATIECIVVSKKPIRETRKELTDFFLSHTKEILELQSLPINEVKQPIQVSDDFYCWEKECELDKCKSQCKECSFVKSWRNKVSDDELIEKFKVLIFDGELYDYKGALYTHEAIKKCVEIAKEHTNTILSELEKWTDEQKITFEFACKLKAKIKTLK